MFKFHDCILSEVFLTCYPVNSYTLYPANAVSDHILSPSLISLGPADGAKAHVHPVDCVIVWENEWYILNLDKMFHIYTLNCSGEVLPAWKSMPTAREVPDTGTRASDLSDGSKGIPRIPSCTEYKRKEPTPAGNKCKFWRFKKFI